MPPPELLRFSVVPVHTGPLLLEVAVGLAVTLIVLSDVAAVVQGLVKFEVNLSVTVPLKLAAGV